MAKGLVSVSYSQRAFTDIDRIIEFNNSRNLSDTYSKKFLTGLNKRLQKLARQPLSGIKTDSDSFLLIWNQFYVFYEFDGAFINVASIYHQKENIIR